LTTGERKDGEMSDLFIGTHSFSKEEIELNKQNVRVLSNYDLSKIEKSMDFVEFVITEDERKTAITGFINEEQ
jgi:hypothetical protein